MKLTFALIATMIAVAGNIPYLRDVLTRRVEPHPYTWLVWSIVSGITFLGQYAKGAGIGVLPAAVAELFTIVIFFFALRNGFRNVVKMDTYFLIVALLGIVPWAVTNDPTISVIIAVSIDVIAFVPTLRKTWRAPQTETPVLYGMNVLRHSLTLFSLQAYNIATTLHSIVMIILNTFMTSLVLRKFKKDIRH